MRSTIQRTDDHRAVDLGAGARPADRQRSRLWVVAAIGTLLAAGLSACAGGGGRSGQAGFFDPNLGVQVDPNGVATIALLAPISDRRGPIRDLAQSLANAAQLAASDIRDPSLRLRVYDTNGTSVGAESAARRAVQDGAALMLGPLFAESVATAGPVAREAGVTMLSFSTDSRAAGGNVFLIGFLPENEIRRVVDYAASRSMTTFGALAPRSRLGDLTMQELDQSMQAADGRIVARQRYVQDFQGIEQGVQSYVAQHSAQPDFQPVQAVFLADQGQALQSLAAYLAYFDVSPSEVKFLGAGGWRSESTLKEAALRGGWFAGPDPRLTEQFAQRYQQSYDAAPHPLASLGYDAVAAAGAMLAEARARGDSYPFTVETITAPSGFAGVNGVFRFLPNGANERGLAVLEVSQGGFTVVDPAPTSFAGY